MKELWTTNPFHLVNSSFAEIGYSSSEPNVVPAHLLLATRRPSARHPLASGAASADANRYPHPLVRTSRRHYGRRFAGIGAPYPLLTIRLLPAQHPSAPCMPSARQLTVQCPPALHKPPANTRRSICCLSATHSTASGGSLQAICQCPRAPPSVGPLHSIRHLTANHPPSRCTPSGPLHSIRHRTAQHPLALSTSSAAPSGNPLTRSDALNSLHERAVITNRHPKSLQKHVLRNY